MTKINIIKMIRHWMYDKKEKANERKMKKKYPQWNPENWIDDLEFVWGIKSYDCLLRCDANIHTMNDIEIDYDHKDSVYYLSVETAYMFQNKQAECKYLKGLLKCLEEYMDNHQISRDSPDGLFMRNIGISMTAETIAELYWDFKLYVNGFCSLYESEE